MERKARPWVAIPEDYINWSIRFVSEKHPEWLKDKYTLRDIKVHPWLKHLLLRTTIRDI